MTNETPTTCASCGAAGTGRLCSTCGAPRSGAACPSCGGSLSPAARFCPSCGRNIGGAAASTADRTPWMIAGAALVGLLGVLLFMIARSSPPSTAAAEPSAGVSESGGLGDPAGGEAPPDLSNMSPRERFNRLYNRVMRAAQSGDEVTVTRFTPMALMAYAQLDTLDADARYHAAMLQIHTGDVAGPTALADTILKRTPAHLLGYVLGGTIARWQKDERGLARAYAGFLEHDDAETKAARPEYKEHKTLIDEFRQTAKQARPAAKAGS